MNSKTCLQTSHFCILNCILEKTTLQGLFYLTLLFGLLKFGRRGELLAFYYSVMANDVSKKAQGTPNQNIIHYQRPRFTINLQGCAIQKARLYLAFQPKRPMINVSLKEFCVFIWNVNEDPAVDGYRTPLQPN